MAITDADGNCKRLYTMEAFGNVLEVGASDYYSEYADVQPYHLTTKEWDADAGLYYFNARWYAPWEGRFVSREPIRIDGPNLYHFCFNRPAYYVDPDGRSVALDITFPSATVTPVPGLGFGAGCEYVWLPDEGWGVFSYPQYGFAFPPGEVHFGVGPIFRIDELEQYTGYFVDITLLAPVMPGGINVGFDVSFNPGSGGPVAVNVIPVGIGAPGLSVMSQWYSQEDMWSLLKRLLENLIGSHPLNPC
jgi:RHS repeat-associated protein